MLKPTAHGTTAWAEDQPFLVPPFAIARTADNWLSRLRSMLIVAVSVRYGTYPCREISNCNHALRKTLSKRNFPFVLAHCFLHAAISESSTNNFRQHFSHKTRRWSIDAFRTS